MQKIVVMAAMLVLSGHVCAAAPYEASTDLQRVVKFIEHFDAQKEERFLSCFDFFSGAGMMALVFSECGKPAATFDKKNWRE